MIYIISGLFKSITRWQLRQALNTYKQSAGPRQSLQLARLLMRSGSGSQAVRVLALAKRRFPDHKGVRRAYRLAKRQQATRSLKRVERLLAKETTLRLLSKACDLCCALQQYERAAEFANEATELYPNDWQSHYILGKLYFQQSNKTHAPEDHEQAISHLDLAYQINPDDYDVLLLLAISLARVDEYDIARDLVERILHLWPNDARALKLIRHIDQARDVGPEDASDREFETAGDGAPVDELDALLANLGEIEGEVGAFIFDLEGTLLRSCVHESDNFTLSSMQDTIESMIRACHVDVSRIGIGQFQSCFICGVDWQILVRSFDTFDMVAFFERSHGEELENEIAELVQNSDAA